MNNLIHVTPSMAASTIIVGSFLAGIFIGIISGIIIGIKIQRSREPGDRQRARWFINKYEEAEREKGYLQARLNIIKQAVMEEI